MRCAALVGAKPAKLGLAAEGGRVARHHDRAASRVDHRRRERAGEVEERHDVDLEVALEVGGLDVEEAAERAADGVVDEHARVRPVALDRGDGRRDRGRVGDVAGEAARPGNLSLERREPLAVPREHRDAVAARAKRRASAAPVPGPTPVMRQTPRHSCPAA